MIKPLFGRFFVCVNAILKAPLYAVKLKGLPRYTGLYFFVVFLEGQGGRVALAQESGPALSRLKF